MKDALMLLAIGMTTVLIALSMVVFVGNIIIRFVNKYVPDTVVKIQKTTQSSKYVVQGNKLAAIVSAVDIATGGKAKIVSIIKK